MPVNIERGVGSDPAGMASYTYSGGPIHSISASKPTTSSQIILSRPRTGPRRWEHSPGDRKLGDSRLTSDVPVFQAACSLQAARSRPLSTLTTTEKPPQEPARSNTSLWPRQQATVSHPNPNAQTGSTAATSAITNKNQRPQPTENSPQRKNHLHTLILSTGTRASLHRVSSREPCKLPFFSLITPSSSLVLKSSG